VRRKRLTLTVDAGDRVESFLVAGIATVLGIRMFLELTGYPQIGGEGLHIAHLLWGGVGLTAAVLIAIGVIGGRSIAAAAIIGGIGFGFFIDEIGKFVTSDNDYFYPPAIALIYVSFVVLTLVLRAIRSRGVPPEAALPNALLLLADAQVDGFDPDTRRRVLRLIDQAPADAPLRTGLRDLVVATPARDAAELGLYQRIRAEASRRYVAIADRAWFQRVVIAAAVLYLGFGLPQFARAVITGNADELTQWLGGITVVGISSTLVLVLLLLGVYRVLRGRALAGYRSMQQAVLISLLIAQPFEFWDAQLAALPSLVASLVSFGALRYMIQQEEERAASATVAAQT
jgi:hypothetical protein